MKKTGYYNDNVQVPTHTLILKQRNSSEVKKSMIMGMMTPLKQELSYQPSFTCATVSSDQV